MVPQDLMRGKLDAAEKQHLDQWLKDHACHCPACGKTEWGEADNAKISLLSGSQGYPVHRPVTIVPCGHCGYLCLFCSYAIELLKA
jgi:hypothetical protein